MEPSQDPLKFVVEARSRLEGELSKIRDSMQALAGNLAGEVESGLVSCREQIEKEIQGRKARLTELEERVKQADIHKPVVGPGAVRFFSIVVFIFVFYYLGLNLGGSLALAIVLHLLTGLGGLLLVDSKTIGDVFGWFLGGLFAFGIYYGVAGYLGLGKGAIIYSFLASLLVMTYASYTSHMRQMRLKEIVGDARERIEKEKKAVEELSGIIGDINLLIASVKEAKRPEEIYKLAANIKSVLDQCSGDIEAVEAKMGALSDAMKKESLIREAVEVLEYAEKLITETHALQSSSDPLGSLRGIESLCGRIRRRLIARPEELKGILPPRVYSFLKPIRDGNTCSKLVKIGYEIVASDSAGIMPDRKAVERNVKRILVESVKKHGTGYPSLLAKSILGMIPPQEVATATDTFRQAEYARISSIEKYLTRSLKGLSQGPNCRGKKFPVNGGSVDLWPQGLEREWACCLLGCGGWGCVYRCRGKSGVYAAFKVPKRLKDDFEAGRVGGLQGVGDRARRFMRLRHSNVLRLKGYGRRFPVLVYEYASLGSLAWQLARGWNPGLRDLVFVGVQVGDALRYIHSRGLVHGDVKPGNILVSGRGYAILGDLTQLSELLAETTSGILSFATPGWRAPEQVYPGIKRRVIERGLEARADVYQLGNLLLYMATGSTLDGREAFDERARERLASRIPGRLGDVVRRALSPQPWVRPSSEEMVRSLLEIAESSL